MSQFSDPAKVRSKMGRLSYPALFKPKAFGKKQEGTPKYQATHIIDPDSKAGAASLDYIEAAIDFVGEEKWGKDWPKIKKKLTKDGRICLREGDEDAEETDGMMVLVTSNEKRPLTLDENGDEVTEADDVLYGGCYTDLIARIWAQDNDYGQRINASLEGVKFRKDGDPFSASSRTSADDFDDDDDDEKPRGRGRGRSRDDDDEDEKPKSRGRRSRDDDDEDEKPRGRGRGRSRDDDDDEDEKPRSRGRGRSRDDDDDEDEKPRGRGRGRSRDDDDEDEKPKSRGRGRSRDDDDEDEKPRSRRGSSRDDDEDEKPKSRRRSRDDDEDEEPKSSRRRRSRDDDDY